MDIKIYVANLGAYNRGHLIGEWLELPMDEDELNEAIQEVLDRGTEQAKRDNEYGGFPDEEVAIHDYEAPFEISEYQNITALNERLEEIDSHDELSIKVLMESESWDFFSDDLQTYLESGEYIIINAMKESYGIRTACRSMGEVAQYFWSDYDGMLLPSEVYEALQNNEALENYINWDSVENHLETTDTWSLVTVDGETYAVKTW